MIFANDYSGERWQIQMVKVFIFYILSTHFEFLYGLMIFAWLGLNNSVKSGVARKFSRERVPENGVNTGWEYFSLKNELLYLNTFLKDLDKKARKI